MTNVTTDFGRKPEAIHEELDNKGRIKRESEHSSSVFTHAILPEWIHRSTAHIRVNRRCMTVNPLKTR